MTSPNPDSLSHDFFSLTPDHVLSAVEHSGHPTTGLCYVLNSLENRVFEVELENRSRVVVKFYRPGRWSEATIRDEHRLLQAMREAEIPVCAPTPFPDGDTLHRAANNIFFTIFPRTGGRCPDELASDEYEQIGRLLGRIHNVSASLGLNNRPRIAPETYGKECLATILACASLSAGVRARYEDAVERVVEFSGPYFHEIETFVVHGDCHRANLLRTPAGFYFLDFDDCGWAPAVQDLWLLLPARPSECPQEVEALLSGYECFRDFDRQTLNLVEILRALRYVRYAAWIAQRWEDPGFQRAFPDWGSDRYWEGQVQDLYEQLALIPRHRSGYHDAG